MTGAIAAGWPQWTGGWSGATPAVGDLTGDGTVDVAVTTREGYLHIYSTPGLAARITRHGTGIRTIATPGITATIRVRLRGSRFAVSFGGAMDTLSFTAVGDDWKSGTAASYQVFASSKPITQSNSNSAKVIVVSATPQPSGSHEVISVPH